jgi:hypothetical protein
MTDDPTAANRVDCPAPKGQGEHFDKLSNHLSHHRYPSTKLRINQAGLVNGGSEMNGIEFVIL